MIASGELVTQEETNCVTGIFLKFHCFMQMTHTY